MSISTQEKIAIMQAYVDGKQIQRRLRARLASTEFEDVRPTDPLAWNWAELEYRIKPKPLELWVNTYKNSKSEEEWAGNVHKSYKAARTVAGSHPAYLRTVRMVEQPPCD